MLHFLFPGEISVPAEETNEKVKEKVKEKIRNGEINIGQLIIPKNTKSLCLMTKMKFKKLSFLLRGGKSHSMKSVNEHCKSTKDIPGPTQMSTIAI